MVKIILFPMAFLGATALASGLVSSSSAIGWLLTLVPGLASGLTAVLISAVFAGFDSVGVFIASQRDRFGIGHRRSCFRLWLGRFGFRFGFVSIHSVPLIFGTGTEVTILHMEDSIRVFVDARIMRHNQNAAIFIEDILFHKRDDHPACIAIERGGRFVKNQNFGRLMIARAIATRCCSPPESLTGSMSPRFFRPTISSRFLASLRASSQLCCFKISGTRHSRPWSSGKQMEILKDKANRVQTKIRQLVVI